ncbi:9954_t:CDS:1 [Acaulospora colombiana]|uniref:9954_t:CDS:1 n=1 Tax=Acaulospora colombiana TaxID=27376 RepID=A0ACA9KNF5_9GLOM|nr:9954_t:CDS:1 [Acaulospora colombiana]
MTEISTILPPITDTAGHHGYPGNHVSGEVSPGGRRLTVQELLVEPVRSSEGRYSPSVIGSSRAPSPTKLTGSTILQHGGHTTSPLQGGLNRYSQSPPTLPLPIPPQLMRIPPVHQSPQKPGMEIDSYKLLPTPLTSPTPVPIIPVSSVKPLHQYSPPPTTPSPTSSVSSPLQLEDQSSYMNTIATTNMVMPLSLSERRERNKVASAKYRAKKHKQNQEMNVQINELNAENNVLRRQNEELKAENGELKELVDKLKSKLVEGKILKRLGRGGAKLTAAAAVNGTAIGTTTEGLTALTTIRKGAARRSGFGGHAKGTGPSPKNAKK